MSKPVCVFILGNGFSMGMGFPSSEELWNISLELSKQFASDGLGKSLEKAKAKYPLSCFIEKNITDIELMCSIWESYHDAHEYVSEVFGESAGTEESTIEDYKFYISNLCGHLIDAGNNVSSNENYTNFKKWLYNNINNFKFKFITLNYDLILEKILSSLSINISYLNKNRDHSKQISVRKLHGSANWYVCGGHSLFYDKPIPLLWSDGKTDIYNHNLDKNYSELLSPALGFPPVIIPPIVNKRYNKFFFELLKNAGKDLETADCVVIIGYSFPEGDLLIRKFLEHRFVDLSKKQIKIYYIDKEITNKTKELFKNKIKVEFIEEKWSVEKLDKILKVS